MICLCLCRGHRRFEVSAIYVNIMTVALQYDPPLMILYSPCRFTKRFDEDDLLIPTASYITPVVLKIASPMFSGTDPDDDEHFITNGEWYDVAVMTKRSMVSMHTRR